MKIALYLTFLFMMMSTTSFSKGISGYYKISGKAFNKKGDLITSSSILVIIDGAQKNIKTDSLGNYEFKVFYQTACPSVTNAFNSRRVTNQMNPKFIKLKYRNNSIKIRNKWRKYRSKRVRYLELIFE